MTTPKNLGKFDPLVKAVNEAYAPLREIYKKQLKQLTKK